MGGDYGPAITVPAASRRGGLLPKFKNFAGMEMFMIENALMDEGFALTDRISIS